MIKLWIPILLTFGYLLPSSVFSQDILGGQPLFYNSSFAGSVSNARICSNLGFQFRNYGTYKNRGYNFSASYDNFFPVIRSGVGITAYTNNYIFYHGDPKYKEERSATAISLAIAPKISIKGNYTISPSLDINYSKEYKSRYDNSQHNGFRSRAGILFNTNKYYIGLSVLLFRSKDLLPIYYNHYYSTLQMGYSFQKNQDSRFAFTPQLVLPISLRTHYIVDWPGYNLRFRYDNYIFGLISGIYFVPTGIQIGWQKKGWRILLNSIYSSNYNADLSFRYIINQQKEFSMF